MKKVEVIGMPMKYGCFVEGADLSYGYLKEIFEKVFNDASKKCVDNSFDSAFVHKNDKKIKYIEEVIELSKRLYNEVYSSLDDDKLPIIVGGDHSTCIGSISSVLDYYKGDVSVIYIDKHADIHNDKTTPSGNVHGMPLSICIGRCDDRFNIGKYKLNPSNLYYVGLSNYEIEEISYISENNIYCRMAFEVEEMKVEKIVKEILSKIKTKYVHISLDLDVIKADEFPAVNVGVENKYQDDSGLSLKVVKKISKLLIENLEVSSMDIVEYNPLLDKDNSCREKIEEILLDINSSLEVKYDNGK